MNDDDSLRLSLRRHVEELAGRIGERNSFLYASLEAARRYIGDALSQAGYTVALLTYKARDRVYSNVIASRAGARSPKSLLVVGAHYDTAPGTPGADDNASGIACLLELARAIGSRTPAMSLRFAAFTLEEPPFFHSSLMGSRVYARSLRQAGEQVAGMISLEMVGYYREERGSQLYPFPLLGWFYPNRGNFVVVAGNFRSRQLVRRLAGALAAQKKIPVESIALPCVPGVGLSDNWSFWKEGYPAVMITDTAFFRNPHYHQPSDLPETLDYGRMARLVGGLSEALVSIDFSTSV